MFGETGSPPEQRGSITPPPFEEKNDLEYLIREYGFWGYFLALGLAFVTGLLLSFSRARTR